jgi:protein-tyrosine phosphatase
MILWLTKQVAWGNWEAPRESAGQFKTIINVAHHFSGRRGRNAYWALLENLPWDIFYARLALKDRHDVTDEYCWALERIIDAAVNGDKLPILTHCQMGWHRGPSSAIFTAWHLAGRTRASLDESRARALELHPNLANGRNYYHSLMAWCERRSC